nr:MULTISPECIES: MoxR family ATPase [unclassified Marinobacterium]
MTPLHELRSKIEEIIVGQESVIDRLLIALLSGGHVLLEGPPGLAKTTLVHSLAAGMNARFQRVQFTPDLMPADLTGSEVFDANSGSFRFIEGPLFYEVLLADEINRAPPKVQSALLEAMAEHQITVAGKTYPLPPVFMVLATQNPLEQSGTYPLPEAQLDRFLFKIVLDYPSIDEEIEITRRARAAQEGHVEADMQALLTPSELLALRETLNSVFIEERVERFAIELVSATRRLNQYIPEWCGYVKAGASPRASIALLQAATARALLNQRDFVLPEDIHALAVDVLRHRLVLSFSAKADGVTEEAVIHRLLETLPAV